MFSWCLGDWTIFSTFSFKNVWHVLRLNNLKITAETVKKKRHVMSYISTLCSCSAICVFLLHRLNIACFASLNYWELNIFDKPAAKYIIFTKYYFYMWIKNRLLIEENKISESWNECVYNTSITVYTQMQSSCVTLNYTVVSCLFLYCLWSPFETSHYLRLL